MLEGVGPARFGFFCDVARETVMLDLGANLDATPATSPICRHGQRFRSGLLGLDRPRSACQVRVRRAQGPRGCARRCWLPRGAPVDFHVSSRAAHRHGAVDVVVTDGFTATSR